VNSFSRWMFWTVMKAKIGSSTATAPSKTQGGTPVQNFVSLMRSIMERGWIAPYWMDIKYPMYPCKCGRSGYIVFAPFGIKNELSSIMVPN